MRFIRWAAQRVSCERRPTSPVRSNLKQNLLLHNIRLTTQHFFGHAEIAGKGTPVFFVQLARRSAF